MPWFSRATGTGFSFSTLHTCRPGSCTEAGNGEPLREGRRLAKARVLEEWPQAERVGQAWGLWCGAEVGWGEGQPLEMEERKGEMG